MQRRPPRSTRTYTLLPYTTLFRSLIVEAFVPFERELSVVAMRGRDGEFRSWPLTEHWHVDGVLSASLAPARVDDAMAAQALGPAQRMADAVGYVGVFALELFQRGGVLLANDTAPRVPNSGHWTSEGGETRHVG